MDTPKSFLLKHYSIISQSVGDINTEAWSSWRRLGVGLTILPCKKKIAEEPPRNSAGFSGGGQGLSWAVERRKEEIRIKDYWNEIHAMEIRNNSTVSLVFSLYSCAEILLAEKT
jgi:hypothetical protein